MSLLMAFDESMRHFLWSFSISNKCHTKNISSWKFSCCLTIFQFIHCNRKLNSSTQFHVSKMQIFFSAFLNYNLIILSISPSCHNISKKRKQKLIIKNGRRERINASVSFRQLIILRAWAHRNYFSCNHCSVTK